MLRTPFCLLVLSLLLSGCSTSSQVSTISNGELQVRQLVPGVYQHITFLQTETYGRVGCNGMVYAKNGEAVIFDTPSNNEASHQLLNWVETELGSTVKAVVVNHFHVDCLGSLEVFHQKGIPSYANQRTIDLATTAGEAAVPQTAIDEETSLTVGGNEINNRYFGAGHTLDNIVSYLPEERVLFGGCMIKSVGASKGNLADADVNAWPETVAKVRAAYPNVKWVIPGHGQAGGSELLEYTQLLFGGNHQAAIALGALTDFRVVDSVGFVPAYRHGDKQALAIDATKHKGKFAFAEAVFNGPAGVYDAELTSLGETDGESTYRIYVRNKELASVQNKPTSVDYAPQQHALGKVRLKPGDRIGVSFNSSSNDKIPEGDGFAYARGRWTKLLLRLKGD